MGDILDNFQKAKIGKPYGSDLMNASSYFMTQEEAIFCEKSYTGETNCTDCNYYGTDTCRSRESHRMAIKALEQELELKQFAKWVAKEIFDENWEYNKEAFAELACRKLAKLGIVIRMGDEWELVESLEKRCADCNHYGKLSLDCGRCDDDCSMYEPNESEDK